MSDDEPGAGSTDTLEAARAHARAQAAAATPVVTIPSRDARDLPGGVDASDVVWDETVPIGGYAARRLARDSVVRITDLDGDAAVSLLVFRADHPAERLNVADTVKVQWQAYLGPGAILLSDMGRVLLSIVEDTCGRHDTFCNASTAWSNAAKYGDGAVWGTYPNARDRLLLAAAKHGLERRDLGAAVNLFKRVVIRRDGGLEFDETPGVPGEYVELRAEMRVLVALANAPHVLDPRAAYVATPVRLLAWRGPIAGEDDGIRRSTPERRRAFENTDDYHAGVP